MDDASAPLPAMLSQVLVALTVEFDNEFERLVPHRITRSKSAARHKPWLLSLAMYANFMQFVKEEGISIAELQRLTRTTKKGVQQWLGRMETWWGYIVVDPLDGLVRPSVGGRKALDVWRPLATIMEARWDERFGGSEIDTLRARLQSFVKELNLDLPDYLPILKYGLFSEVLVGISPAPENPSLPLTALLSKVLLAFALEFERDWGLSLAICSNVLRVLNEEGIRVRDLPRLTGVSMEAVKMSLGFLEKREFAAMEPRLAGLTPKGLLGQTASKARVAAIEENLARTIRRGFGNGIAKLAGTVDCRTVAAGFGAVSGWLARVASEARDAATLPDGASSRRLPGWILMRAED